MVLAVVVAGFDSDSDYADLHFAGWNSASVGCRCVGLNWAVVAHPVNLRFL